MLPDVRPGRPLRQRVLPPDEGHGGLPRRSGLARGGPYPGPQRPCRLSARYAHLRTWITRQRPFPTFLQIRDDLVMEELQQGVQAPSTSTPESSSSSTAHAATPPPRSTAPPQLSLLGPLPPGVRGDGGAVAAAVAAAEAMELVVGAPQHRHLHRVHPGHPTRTHGQGASPCGRSRLPVASLARRRPCSQVLPRGSPQRPGGRPRSPRPRGLLHPRPCPGLPAGTRRPWPTPSAPWP